MCSFLLELLFDESLLVRIYSSLQPVNYTNAFGHDRTLIESCDALKIGNVRIRLSFKPTFRSNWIDMNRDRILNSNAINTKITRSEADQFIEHLKAA
jgi:hypothetical protein